MVVAHKSTQRCECGHARSKHENWIGQCEDCECKLFRRSKAPKFWGKHK